MFTFRTIRTGERAAVWGKDGSVRFVNGPARVLVWPRETVEVLERHAAGADEYLAITFRDGRTEHLRGPAAVYFHPVEHVSIAVEQAIRLDSNEALVVYTRHDAEGGQPPRIARRVVRGPELFVPAANEFLHEFSWHGADPQHPTRKVPRALRFTRLRVIPDQMYFDVEGVRTGDDALVVVQLMIFFELADVETMLDRTHDPVADFINAVTADVIAFASTLSFEAFKERTAALNEISTYPQLVARAEKIGYGVGKVVYRGYQANPRLQGMHDAAIESRTKLRLEAETERQAQDLADLKLRREAERAERRRHDQEAELAHAQKLKRAEAEHLAKLKESEAEVAARLKAAEHERELKRRQADHEQAMRQRRSELEQEMAARRARDEATLAHRQALARERIALLAAMQGMQVDLTRYLVSRKQHPDRIIRLEGNGNRDARPQLHLHGSA